MRAVLCVSVVQCDIGWYIALCLVQTTTIANGTTANVEVTPMYG